MALRLQQRVGTRIPARPSAHLPVLPRPIPRRRALQPSCSLGLEAVGIVANSFTPVQSGLGGLIIGTSVAAQLLLTGRVLGVSGTVRGVATGAPGAWRPAFIAGLALTAVPLALMLPATMVALPPSFTHGRAAIAGLLVGAGASMGNGCTSGHGICGLARFSKRSVVYTLTFMAAGAAAATLTHSAAAAGVSTGTAVAMQKLTPAVLNLAVGVIAVASATFGAIGLLGNRSASAKAQLETLSSFLIGCVFSIGMAISGMTLPSKVVSFLSPTLKAWDPSLAFVMGGALAVATPVYQYVLHQLHKPKCTLSPCLVKTFAIPNSSTIDSKLLLGGIMFGAGWGIGGMCPGPAIVAFAGSLGLRLANILSGSPPLAHCLCSTTGLYLLAMVVGMLLEQRLSNALTPAKAQA